MLPISLMAVAVAYFLGAIPFGLLMARSQGVDIRAVGSRNIGATNVWRSVGTGWGILTLLLDALKGGLPTVLLPLAVSGITGDAGPTWLRLACGCAAIAGHNWPIYLGFKGGKGVATTAGVLAAIAPVPLLAGLVAFGVVFGLSRMVSLGSLSASVVVPGVAWWHEFPKEWLTPAALSILGVIAIWKHRANIVRLAHGQENRIQFRKTHD